MSSQDDIQKKLRAGVDAAKNGDRVTARRLLEQVIEVDENNELAWIWLASAVNTAAERRQCLERVLEINPNNTRAREALSRLGTETTSAATGQPTNIPRSTAPRRESRDADVRESIDKMRRVQQTRAETPTTTQPSIVPLLLVVGVVVLLFVVVAAVLPSVNALLNPPTPTRVVIVPTDTETPTITPTLTLTTTPLGLDQSQVTRIAGPVLPPTFTPTITPRPTETLQPSPTPLGLENFYLVYISLNTGANQPDTYLITADRSYESLSIDAARDVQFLSDGSRIVFIRDFEVEGLAAPEVFVGNPDSGEVNQITNFRNTSLAHPTFSPDGSQIVFVSNQDSTSDELWMMNADGTNLRKLTDDNFKDSEPTFAAVKNANGNDVLAFASNREGSGLGDIYLMELPADDSDPIITRLTSGTGGKYSPSWSQNGQYVVYASDRNGDGDIFVVEAAFPGSDQLVTVDDGDAEDRYPAISPDGRWIAFISNRETDNFQVYLTDRQGLQVTRLTENQRDDVGVVFRPISLDLLTQSGE